MQAITKAEVDEAVGNRVFPDFVIQAFNECIVESRINNTERVFQEDVINKIIGLCPEPLGRQEIFDKRWLDVEPFFKRAGWKVEYWKPAYNDCTGRAYYTFS